MRMSLVVTVILSLLGGLCVGVAAQDEDETPTSTYVTGNYIDSFGGSPEFSEVDGVERMRMTIERVVEWSDPRLPSQMVTRLEVGAGEISKVIAHWGVGTAEALAVPLKE